MRFTPSMGTLHPDGLARPRQDVLFGINETGTTPAGPVTAKTASYTINKDEYGQAFSNLGAAGAVTFTAPTPFAGARLGPFFKPTAQNIVIAAEAGTTINGAASWTNSLAEPYAVIELVGYSPTLWIIRNRQGTWA